MHIDVKKLGALRAGAGKRVSAGSLRRYTQTIGDTEGRRRRTVDREYVHIAVDDSSRLAYAEVLPEKATEASAASTRVTVSVIAFDRFARRAMSPERSHG